MALVIRRSTDAGDIASFLELMIFDSTSAEEFVSARAVLEHEACELGDNRFFYVATDGARTVGVFQLLLKRADGDPDLADGVSIAHLHHVRVAVGRRRQGIGTWLMRHAEQEVERTGFRSLTLGVDSTNDGAIAFYRALGYAELKRVAGPSPSESCLYLRKVI